LHLDGRLINSFIINFSVCFITFGLITSGTISTDNTWLLVVILLWGAFSFTAFTCLGLFYLVHKSLCDVILSKIEIDDEEDE
jgi:hypothetical protein